MDRRPPDDPTCVSHNIVGPETENNLDNLKETLRSEGFVELVGDTFSEIEEDEDHPYDGARFAYEAKPLRKAYSKMVVKEISEGDMMTLLESIKCVGCRRIPRLSPQVRYMCPHGHVYCQPCGELRMRQRNGVCGKRIVEKIASVQGHEMDDALSSLIKPTGASPVRMVSPPIPKEIGCAQSSKVEELKEDEAEVPGFEGERECLKDDAEGGHGDPGAGEESESTPASTDEEVTTPVVEVSVPAPSELEGVQPTEPVLSGVGGTVDEDRVVPEEAFLGQLKEERFDEEKEVGPSSSPIEKEAGPEVPPPVKFEDEATAVEEMTHSTATQIKEVAAEENTTENEAPTAPAEPIPVETNDESPPVLENSTASTSTEEEAVKQCPVDQEGFTATEQPALVGVEIDHEPPVLGESTISTNTDIDAGRQLPVDQEVPASPEQPTPKEVEVNDEPSVLDELTTSTTTEVEGIKQPSVEQGVFVAPEQPILKEGEVDEEPPVLDEPSTSTTTEKESVMLPPIDQEVPTSPEQPTPTEVEVNDEPSVLDELTTSTTTEVEDIKQPSVEQGVSIAPEQPILKEGEVDEELPVLEEPTPSASPQCVSFCQLKLIAFTSAAEAVKHLSVKQEVSIAPDQPTLAEVDVNDEPSVLDEPSAPTTITTDDEAVKQQPPAGQEVPTAAQESNIMKANDDPLVLEEPTTNEVEVVKQPLIDQDVSTAPEQPTTTEIEVDENSPGLEEPTGSTVTEEAVKPPPIVQEVSTCPEQQTPTEVEIDEKSPALDEPTISTSTEVNAGKQLPVDPEVPTSPEQPTPTKVEVTDEKPPVLDKPSTSTTTEGEAVMQPAIDHEVSSGPEQQIPMQVEVDDEPPALEEPTPSTSRQYVSFCQLKLEERGSDPVYAAIFRSLKMKCPLKNVTGCEKDDISGVDLEEHLAECMENFKKRFV